MHSNLIQATSKITRFVRSGKVRAARKMFDELRSRDLIAYNAMLTGYSHTGEHREAISLFQDLRIRNFKPDQYTITAILSSYSGTGNGCFGSVIHGLVINLGFSSSVPVSNALIDMYGKFMSPYDAHRVFSDMGMRNEISWCSLLFGFTNSGLLDAADEVFYKIPKKGNIAWNTMIVGHARVGDIEMCFSLFREMRKNDCCPDHWTLSSLMNVCDKAVESCYGCSLHAFVVKSGWIYCVEVQNSILSFYTGLGICCDIITALETTKILNQVSWNVVIDAHLKIGNTSEAFLLFRQAPYKNVVLYTSMIVGYVRSGKGTEALSIFVDMLEHRVEPDELTFGAVLLACSGLALLQHGMMIHGCLIRHGFDAHVYVGNCLVNVYAKCGDLASSRKCFDEITYKDLISWNAMLFAYGLHGWANQSLVLYQEMLRLGIAPDHVTFTGLLMTCSHAGLIETGKILFESMKSDYGLDYETHHVACLVDMLCRGGYVTEAQSLADKYEGLCLTRKSSSEALLGACYMKFDVAIGRNIGEDSINLEPQNQMSYVLLSNLYCSSGRWEEAEMVRRVMFSRGVRKIPGCSWI